jgi:ferredoxin-NADP reductase
MPTIWYESVVTRIAIEAPNVRRFWIQTPEIAQHDFRAGQFLTFDLPIGDKRLQRWRSYSIASAPDGSNILELCIVRSAAGAGSRYFFETIEVGSTLRWKGPDGAFYLPETIENDLVLICTGTGIAPFRSMLLDLQNRQAAHRKIHLIFGCRTEADILYRTELEALAAQNNWFQYDVALSRQSDGPGVLGYVHQLYLEKYKTVRPDLAFYICGWSKMIDETVANLIVHLGYDRQQVHYELYG